MTCNNLHFRSRLCGLSQTLNNNSKMVSESSSDPRTYLSSFGLSQIFYQVKIFAIAHILQISTSKDMACGYYCKEMNRKFLSINNKTCSIAIFVNLSPQQQQYTICTNPFGFISNTYYLQTIFQLEISIISIQISQLLNECKTTVTYTTNHTYKIEQRDTINGL